MIDDLTLVVGRQCDAAEVLEARLRALELLLHAGEQRFLAMAVDEVEDASERLAALELTRSLAMAAIGAPDDLTASDVVAAVADERGTIFAERVDRLRGAVARVTVSRERIRRLVLDAQADGQRRLAVAGVA